MKTVLKKWMIGYLVVALFAMGAVPRVHAGFAPSEGWFPILAERETDLEKVRKFLEMKMVRERLKDLGFSSEEIQGKLGGLNDRQVHQLALKIDELHAGGNGLGFVIAVLVIVILVIIIIQLTGHRIVVK